MRVEEVRKQFGMPFDNPLYPRPPYEYKNGKILMVLYRTTRKQIEAILPEPLMPGRHNYAMVQIMDFPDVSGFGPYMEALTIVEAELDGKQGVYCPYIYVNSDSPLAAGREIWGNSKKMADISLTHQNDTTVGKVSRNSVPIASASLPYKYEHSSMEEIEEKSPISPMYTLKIIPGVEGNTDIMQLTSVVLEDVKIKECWKGPATLELLPNTYAPMHKIGVEEVVEGYYFIVDWNLPWGKVEYDYLTTP